MVRDLGDRRWILRGFWQDIQTRLTLDEIEQLVNDEGECEC